MHATLSDTKTKLQKFETSLDLFGEEFHRSVLPGADAERELTKSLKQIKIAYKKNIELLGKDLNRMEFRVTQIRDTRERISIKHIKSLDIVEKEVHRIMPNSLTETQIRREMPKRRQPAKRKEGEDQPLMTSSIENIKNDLESDDIFLIAFRGQHQGRGLADDRPANGTSGGQSVTQS